MKTIMQDPELDCELQELYILSRHWTSDIQFVEDEIRFLKNVIKKYLVPGLENGQLPEIEFFTIALDEQEVNIPGLKKRISKLLKFMEPIINEENKEIGIDLLERFTTLEKEMQALFESVKLAKSSLFSVAEKLMKTEKCSLFLNQF